MTSRIIFWLAVLLLGSQKAYSACILVTSATSLSQAARNAGYTTTA